MEEKSMKDFDRNIERALTDYSVAPPFGVWNRIQSELDAAEPAPPVALPLIPRGVLAGFFAGAALIGTLVGGWFMYNNSGTTATTPTGVETSIVTTPAIQSTQQPVIETNNNAPVVAINHVVKTNSSKSSINMAPVAETSAAANTASTEDQTIGLTSLASIEKQEKKDSQVYEAYYFPPVDINTPESNNEEVVADLYRGYNTPSIGEPAKTAEVKKKSSSNDSRMKFKKKRKPRGGFSYGRLNRLKPGSR